MCLEERAILLKKIRNIFMCNDYDNSFENECKMIVEYIDFNQLDKIVYNNEELRNLVKGFSAFQENGQEVLVREIEYNYNFKIEQMIILTDLYYLYCLAHKILNNDLNDIIKSINNYINFEQINNIINSNKDLLLM